MTYVFRAGDLPRLDLQVDRGSDFKAWRDQWNAYTSLSGLKDQDAAKQVQALTLCFSRETVTIVNNLSLTAAQLGDAEQTVTAITEYVEGQINESVERHHFRQRRQQPGESVDDFLVSLRELAKTCNFCTEACTQKSIRDQIVEGISDGDAIEELLQDRDLTLVKAITKCRAKEAAKRQRDEITGTNIGNPPVQVVQKPSPRNSSTCPGCGAGHHQGGRQSCPAYRVTCHNCNKPGHFARVCRSRRRQQVANVQEDNQDTAPATSAVTLDPLVFSTAIESAPTIEIQMSSLNGNATAVTLPDSGAEISIAGPSLLKLLHEHPDNLLPSTTSPRAVNGSTMKPIGKLPVKLVLGSRQITEEFHIYAEVSATIISWKIAKYLRILPSHYPIPAPLDKPSVAHTKVTAQSDPQADYPSVFDGVVKTMDGELFHIALTEDAKPFCVHTPRTIPYAYRDKLEAELQLLQEQNIIAPVTEPTEWCAPIVVAPKKGTDKIRMCVDLSHLNKYVKRERYQCLTPAQAVADIAAENAKVFTKLDALKGYHQCPLDEESQLLTTFITPFGRFKYLRAPYGISSISEHYNRRMDEAFAGLAGYRRVVDDVVIFDSDEANHATHVRQFLQRCAERMITINKEKWEYNNPEVTFAGFQLSKDGYRIDTAITDAITNFPTPASRTDLRGFFGLANQLAASNDSVATLLGPMRPLLSTKNEFLWSDVHDQAFQKAKQFLSSAPTLAYFDPTKSTRLCTDASRNGLGFVLQQRHQDKWALVQAGSRFLSDAESRYAIIELEMLAVSWAVIKCRVFLAGLPHFTVLTDHHPLIPILNNHRLDEIENPRLQRLKMKVMGYAFTAEWVKGAQNNAPDALSRNPVSDPKPEELLAEGLASPAEVRALTNSGHHASLRLTDLRHIAEQDDEYQQLKHYIEVGFPQKRDQMPTKCQGYWNVRNQLTVDDGLIIFGCRLLIPVKLRQSALHQLHDAHQGTVRTKSRARLIVYWPGMDKDIDNITLACKSCQDVLPSHPPEPMVEKQRPSRPFQELAADFCSYGGHQFLITVDCCTDWPEIVHMGKDTTATRLNHALLGVFSRYGVPDVIWSDQGPQFTSHTFQYLAKEWGIKHVPSSPTYPQSNGKAESAVKSMKKIIRGSWNGNQLDPNKLARSLLQYRNTPSRRDGRSPAQKLYGQSIQDTLPAHRLAFTNSQQGHSEEPTVDNSNQLYYNQKAHPLSDIQVGTNVAIQNTVTKRWDTYGLITHVGPHRQYHVKMTNGRTLIRNRRLIRRRIPLLPLMPPRAPLPPNPPPPPPLPSSQTSQALRRSTRPRRPPPRYADEFSSK